MWLKLFLILFTGVITQLAVFDNINLGILFNPLIYSIFLLKLPLRLKGWLLLIWAFFLGSIMDILQVSYGINAAACLTMAFIRPAVIKWVSPQTDYGEDELPSISSLGLQNYFFYLILLLFAHHFIVFILEEWSFAQMAKTLLRTLTSTAMALFIILSVEYLLFNK